MGKLPGICRPIKEGGLGIRSISTFNKALLGKWLWKFGNERVSLWRKVIAAKYGEGTYGWNSLKPSGWVGCSLWKSIYEGTELFQRFIRFKVNNGDMVQFWTDCWCTREDLKQSFPHFFMHSNCKEGSVRDHMIRSTDHFSLRTCTQGETSMTGRWRIWQGLWRLRTAIAWGIGSCQARDFGCLMRRMDSLLNPTMRC